MCNFLAKLKVVEKFFVKKGVIEIHEGSQTGNFKSPEATVAELLSSTAINPLHFWITYLRQPLSFFFHWTSDEGINVPAYVTEFGGRYFLYRVNFGFQSTHLG